MKNTRLVYTKMTTFVERFQSAREAAGLSREKLGSELGKSGRTVERWERGEGEPGVADLAQLARVLGAGQEALWWRFGTWTTRN